MHSDEQRKTTRNRDARAWEVSGTYSSRDWERLTQSWTFMAYVAWPGTTQPVERQGSPLVVKPDMAVAR